MTAGRRAGASLVEVLVALLLTFLVARAGWSALSGQRGAAEAVTLGAEAQEVGRTVRRVLGAELRSGVPGVDWRAHPGDSLTLRAFRGAGLACESSESPARRWAVAYRGIRAPNPDKDSALVLRADGRWRALGISDAEGGGPACAPSSLYEAYRITLDREVSEVTLIRVFERGSYHLTGNAFRYRIGLGGRQPLTPERLTSASSLGGRKDGALLLLDYRWIGRISRPLPESWTLWTLSR